MKRAGCINLGCWSKNHFGNKIISKKGSVLELIKYLLMFHVKQSGKVGFFLVLMFYVFHVEQILSFKQTSVSLFKKLINGR